MPAPTALQRRPEEFIEDATKDVEMDASAIPLPIEDHSELVDMSIDAAPVPNEPTQAPEDISMTDEPSLHHRPLFPWPSNASHAKCPSRHTGCLR
jgi:RNA-binding protein PNO1